MSIKEILAKSAVHYHERAFATNWDINPYRGCGHRCVYCFAQYSHKYLDSDQFFDDITVKTNVAEVLNADFSKRSWQKCPVNLCGVTDCYQPLEKQYELMQKIIETFIKHKNPMIITTKSTLLLRDLDLLEELNKVAHVDIRASVSAIDERIREKIEPFASPTLDRLNMLNEISKRGIDAGVLLMPIIPHLTDDAGVLLMPIIPHLTDDAENLDEIFRTAKENGATSVIPAPLHLRCETKRVFYDYLKNLFPELPPKIVPLYKGAYLDKNYAENLRQKIASIRRKYDFYNKVRECRKSERDIQMKLLWKVGGNSNDVLLRNFRYSAIKRMDSRAFYVAMTRHVEDVDLYYKNSDFKTLRELLLDAIARILWNTIKRTYKGRPLGSHSRNIRSFRRRFC